MTNLLILATSIFFLTKEAHPPLSICDSLKADTTEITFACLMDTGDVLWYFDFYYPDQLDRHVNCIMYHSGNFSDTGFNLNLSEIMELDKQSYSTEFLHCSRYFKKHDLIYLPRYKKRKFKGFRFKVFKRKVTYCKNEITFCNYYLWPSYDKYLRTAKAGYIISNIRILE